jgi:hypothetical protein
MRSSWRTTDSRGRVAGSPLVRGARVTAVDEQHLHSGAKLVVTLTLLKCCVGNHHRGAACMLQAGSVCVSIACAPAGAAASTAGLPGRPTAVSSQTQSGPCRGWCGWGPAALGIVTVRISAVPSQGHRHPGGLAPCHAAYMHRGWSLAMHQTRQLLFQPGIRHTSFASMVPFCKAGKHESCGQWTAAATCV